MDCKLFNEYITEIEAKKLTKKQIEDFLNHKDVCPDCGEVYDLLFGIEDNFELDEINSFHEGTISNTIMDKIQVLEHKGYNFKLYNSLNLFFGGLVALIVLALVFGETLQIVSHNLELNQVSKNVCLNIEMASTNIVDVYSQSIVYIVITFFLLCFIVTVYDYFKDLK